MQNAKCKKKKKKKSVKKIVLSISPRVMGVINEFCFLRFASFPVAAFTKKIKTTINQRTNGPVNAHLLSWPSKAQNIQNLEKYMVKKLP